MRILRSIAVQVARVSAPIVRVWLQFRIPPQFVAFAPVAYNILNLTLNPLGLIHLPSLWQPGGSAALV